MNNERKTTILNIYSNRKIQIQIYFDYYSFIDQ